MMTIPRIERDNGRMPVLGLGTWEQKGDQCCKAVKTALEMGYRHIDTASMYRNEGEVGDGLRVAGVPREEFFLTTKIAHGQLKRDDARTACAQSLKLLQTDYIDLLLIHWPDESVPLEETLGVMGELRKEGKIRHIGVSNFTVEWIEKAVAIADAPIFCNQIEMHPYLGQGPVLKACGKHGIAVVAYSPLARGRAARDERLAKIGEKYGKSAAQVALRWLVRQDGVAAIPKGTGETHIRDNIDLFDFELDEEDLAIIAAMGKDRRIIDPDWAPDWDTARSKGG